MYNCPNCGKELDDEICTCGFNINETLSCPYTISGNCIHTNKECKITGLDYESCEVYLHKAGISI